MLAAKQFPACIILLVLIAAGCSSTKLKTKDQLGNISFTATGKEEAQPVFKKAVLLLHSFEYVDAAEEFQKVKKIDAETFYAYRGRFTTCNLDTPHFAFMFKKAKFVNQKVVVTGPIHPEFEEVPIPIYLPFGIFPLSSGRHSGNRLES